MLRRPRQLHLFKTCLYCGHKAESKDHVPSQSLLEKPYPLNLWSVPSCTRCNNGFSKDEEYFVVAMAQASTVESLLRRVDDGGSVDRALVNSPKLDDRIIAALRPTEDGRVYLVPEVERIVRVVTKTSHGLYFKCFGEVAPQPRLASAHHVAQLPPDLLALTVRGGRRSMLWPEMGSRRFMQMLNGFSFSSPLLKPWEVIQRGVFEFLFVNVYRPRRLTLCITSFHNTVWGCVGYPQLPTIQLRKRVSALPRVSP